MRDYLHSAIVGVPPKERTHRFAIPEPTCSIPHIARRGAAMPAKPSDLRELRGLLYYLENPPRFDDPVVRRSHVDALKRFIGELEKSDAPSPFWWVAGALKKSHRKIAPNYYMTTDRDLATWAMDQVFQLAPDDEETEQ